MFVVPTTLPPAARDLLGTLQRDIVNAFDNCLEQLRPRNAVGFGAPTEQALAAMTTWFGSREAAALETARLGVQNMRMVLRNASITVDWNERGDFQGVTHVEPGFTPGIMGGAEAQRVANMQGISGSNYAITVTGHWLRMPNYAMGMPSAWQDSDKFQCLVHELSHAVLGTIDVVHGTRGITCYGGGNCRQLARGNSKKALTNADNWGFFVEEFHAFGPGAAEIGRSHV